MTNHISAGLLEGLQPLSGKICAVTEFESKPSNSKERLEALAQRKAQMETDQPESCSQSDSDGLPEMKAVAGTEVRFTKIPKQKWPDGASPMEITKYSMDHSYVLESVLKSEAYKGFSLAILGEIQFSFTCFLIGQVYDGFDQWKGLVHLLCFSDEALANHVQLYDQFITMLHFQIREIPEDFFVDIISRNNFLTTTLQVFFSNLSNLEDQNQDDIKALKKKGDNFRKHLEKKFQWDFTSEDDEYSPVVVTL